jgi:hypothetical protein
MSDATELIRRALVEMEDAFSATRQGWRDVVARTYAARFHGPAAAAMLGYLEAARDLESTLEDVEAMLGTG